jgi:hypothetical protein
MQKTSTPVLIDISHAVSADRIYEAWCVITAQPGR